MKLNAKKIVILMIVVILVSTLEKYLIMTGVFLLLYLAYKNHKENNQIISEQTEQLEVIDNNELDQFRALYDITKKKEDVKYQTMREMDIRQFQGRKDVTVDEVVEYMINKSQYIGLEKRSYQMQRITQVCNLTEDDMKEVFHRIWGKCKINEDVEGLKIANYFDDNVRKLDKEFEEWQRKYAIEESQLKEIGKHDESYMKKFYYEKWLKEKGYIK